MKATNHPSDKMTIKNNNGDLLLEIDAEGVQEIKFKDGSKYTGAEIDAAIAKTGDLTKVTANPVLAGTEAALEGLQVGNVKYKVDSGNLLCRYDTVTGHFDIPLHDQFVAAGLGKTIEWWFPSTFTANYGISGELYIKPVMIIAGETDYLTTIHCLFHKKSDQAPGYVVLVDIEGFVIDNDGIPEDQIDIYMNFVAEADIGN